MNEYNEKISLLFVAIISFYCRALSQVQPVVAFSPLPTRPSSIIGPPSPMLLAAEQSGNRIVIIDPPTKTIVWQWSAQEDPDIPEARRKWFTLPSEVKATPDRKSILFACSGGAVGMIDVKTTRLLCYTYSGSNPHSIERLPGGNIATASSNGSFIKIFRASGKTGFIDSVDYIKVHLESAHSVVWDEKAGLLWSAGVREITGWKYVHSNGEIVLQEAVRRPLPDPDGHDLLQRNDSILLLSTGKNLWSFNTRTESFSLYTACTPHVGVKSISFWDTKGIFVYPNQVWWSDRVYNCDGSVFYQQDNMRFYKVRWW